MDSKSTPQAATTPGLTGLIQALQEAADAINLYCPRDKETHHLTKRLNDYRCQLRLISNDAEFSELVKG